MLSETIYALRRKNGLSQEQLAERIGVSRQAVSKWESGVSTPELEKLRALCRCFHVSMDELTGNVAGSPDSPVLCQSQEREQEGRQQKQTVASGKNRAGLLLCLLGVIGIGAVVIFMLVRPDVTDLLNDSSAVTLNGSGILLVSSALCLILGLIFTLRKK